MRRRTPKTARCSFCGQEVRLRWEWFVTPAPWPTRVLARHYDPRRPQMGMPCLGTGDLP